MLMGKDRVKHGFMNLLYMKKVKNEQFPLYKEERKNCKRRKKT